MRIWYCSLGYVLWQRRGGSSSAAVQIWRIGVRKMPPIVICGDRFEISLQLMNEHGMFKPAALKGTIPLKVPLGLWQYLPELIFVRSPSVPFYQSWAGGSFAHLAPTFA
jgi:hypothetical protein